jgi:hypothetical protein
MKRLSAALVGLTALGAIALAPTAALADCQIGNCWGAVAYGPGGSWAYAVNYSTREIASRMAQRRCGGRCNHVLTFHNSCGAYASGPSAYSHYGWGNAMSRQAAEQRAIYECNIRGPNCQVRVWGCTSR